MIGKALRDLVYEELPDAEERFYGGRRPMGMYRTKADICWIQPHKTHCNIYFMRGTELTDVDQVLEGTSERFKYAKLRSLDDLDRLPLRMWLQESVVLNDAALGNGMTFDQVHHKLQTICLALPTTKETLTWGIPHFRVGEKIFCGCSEEQGRPRIGLKMEAYQSEVMMKLPGIEKAPYSRKGDGWVTIDPGSFDDWEEIEQLLEGSYRLIAPKRTVALLDSKARESKVPRRRKTAKRSK
jgi:predicted DNA-binding protein (MmcQ/YjbR family)